MATRVRRTTEQVPSTTYAEVDLERHNLSGGRFALGFGAGWVRAEIEAIGLEYPPSRDRAGRYVAAIRIVRDLFSSGRAAELVADSLQNLADLGIDALTVMPLTPNRESELATCLFG
jgi:hypothetical protein